MYCQSLEWPDKGEEARQSEPQPHNVPKGLEWGQHPDKGQKTTGVRQLIQAR